MAAQKFASFLQGRMAFSRRSANPIYCETRILLIQLEKMLAVTSAILLHSRPQQPSEAFSMGEHLVTNIDGQSMADLQAFLTANPGSCKLRLQSSGGCLMSALSGAGAIQRHGGVHAVADGQTASAATILLAAANKATAIDTSLIMLHGPRASASGTSDEMRSTAQALDLATQSMKRIYAGRIDESRLDEAMSGADTWLSAQEAHDMGLVDNLEPSGSLAASGDLHVSGSLPPAGGAGKTPPFALRPASPSIPALPAQGFKTNSPDGRIRAASDALLIRCGVIDDQPSNPYRQHRMDSLGTAIQAATGGFAQGVDSLPGVLSNAANRAMGIAFENWNEPWRTLCDPVLVPDFRETSLAALSQLPSAPEIGENTEMENATFGDDFQTASLATYGQLLHVTRRALVNDDVGFLGQISQRLGESTSRAIGDSLAALVNGHGMTMRDGDVLWHSKRENFVDTAPSTAALSGLWTKLALMKDPAGIVSGQRAIAVGVLFPKNLRSVASWLPNMRWA